MKRGTLLKKLDELEREVSKCRACRLALTRRRTVFAAGNPEADLVVVGEGPGEDEDASGTPFVGRAGKLLDRMLETIGRSRKNVYVMNVVKCRACSPPSEEDLRKAPAFWKNRLKNRPPSPEEIEACAGFFERQMDLLPNRKLILAFGGTAGNALLRPEAPLPVSRMRGRVLRSWFGPAVVTFHPSYLLRSPGEKARAWRDLLLAQEFLAMPEKEREAAVAGVYDPPASSFPPEERWRPGLLEFQKDEEERRGGRPLLHVL